jgi:hypothetical protein
MVTTFITMTLSLALARSGQCPDPARCPHGLAEHRHLVNCRSGGFILPPGPGAGWGFPQGEPGGTGWYDPGTFLPLGADRTTDYFFPRYLAVPPEQGFMGTYYNPYWNRGQRYIPFTGNGGWHPMGGPAPDSAISPIRPYSALSGARPVAPVPRLRGRVEASTLDNSGKTGLTP